MKFVLIPVVDSSYVQVNTLITVKICVSVVYAIACEMVFTCYRFSLISVFTCYRFSLISVFTCNRFSHAIGFHVLSVFTDIGFHTQSVFTCYRFSRAIGFHTQSVFTCYRFSRAIGFHMLSLFACYLILLNTKYVSIFSAFLSETFLILKGTERDTINVYRYSYETPAILVRF